MKKEVIAYKNPKSPISEVFRTLRTNIQFMNVNKKMNTLLVTSTYPGEGKSWVAANLAVTFAQAGKKVVLVDSDMRKGRQYVIFGISPKPGLSNFLSQVELDEEGRMSEDISNYVQSTEIKNLYVMAAGNVPPNPSELLVSAQMIRLLDELKKVCDIVIIDGTPSELVTDSVILSRLADYSVIVTAYKKTKKDALERVVKSIQNVGGKIAGVVINKVPISAKKYGENYYYGEDKTANAKIPGKNIGSTIKNNLTFNKASNLKKEDSNVEKKPEPEKKSKDVIEKRDDGIIIQRSNNSKVQENDEVSLDKANDILKQINSYLDQEKKNL